MRGFRRGWLGIRLRGGLRANRPCAPRVPGLLKWVILIAAVLYLAARLTDALIAGPLEAAAENQARLLAIQAVNRVVLDSVAGVTINDLISYRTDDGGKVTALQVDAMGVNRIASTAAKAVQAEMERLAQSELKIPSGMLTGIRLLAFTGPAISVQMHPVGNVLVNIRQRFDEAGINQTRHLVFLETVARIRLVVPFVSKEIEVVSELPLADTVLIGPVPQSLYKGQLGGVTLPGR